MAALVVARAWRDPEYLRRLVAEPWAVLAEEGIHVPDGADVLVHQDTPAVKHVVLPPGLTADDTDAVHALMSAVLPIPTGSTVALVQSGPDVKHLVVPYPPAALDPTTSETAVASLAAAGVTAVYQDAVALTTAVQTEEVVTTTTEAQDVETTTTAAAEAEVVAVVAGVLI